jgi:hypothetical protein
MFTTQRVRHGTGLGVDGSGNVFVTGSSARTVPSQFRLCTIKYSSARRLATNTMGRAMTRISECPGGKRQWQRVQTGSSEREQRRLPDNGLLRSGTALDESPTANQSGRCCLGSGSGYERKRVRDRSILGCEQRVRWRQSRFSRRRALWTNRYVDRATARGSRETWRWTRMAMCL